MSETVIKFIILSGQKIRSRILQFQVGSETCWFRKVRLVKFNKEPAVGQFGFKLDQFILGRLKSPRKIMHMCARIQQQHGRGETVSNGGHFVMT